MKNEHIINILENASLASLSDGDMKTVQDHVSHCHECRQAYNAARVSTLLIKEHAAQTFEPSPFFHTKVMAAIREQKATSEISAFKRWWSAAGSLVYSMAATVVVLFVLTIFNVILSSDPGPQISTTNGNQYSAEEIILAQDTLADNQLTDEQVFTAIYEP